MHITKQSEGKDYYKDKLKGRVVRRFSSPKMYLLCVIDKMDLNLVLPKDSFETLKKWYFSLLVHWAYDRYKVRFYMLNLICLAELDHYVSAGRKRDGFKQLHVSVEFTNYGNTLFRPVWSLFYHLHTCYVILT